MSMLRKAKDLRDRIKVAQGKPQHAPIRTGIRARHNPGRKGGGVRTGISLQYKSLQDPGFEAVLDEIDQYSNPVFGDEDDDRTTGTVAKEAVGGGKKRVSGREATVSGEPLFPPSDDEEGGVGSGGGGGGQYAGVDPLLGQAVGESGDSAHTDSEESEEEEEEVEQLVLDAETVNVLESLHLASGAGQYEDFSESPPGYGIAEGEEREETRDRDEVERGEGEEVEEEGKAHVVVLNESANNNTQVQPSGQSLGNDREEVNKDEGLPPVIENPLLPHSDVEIRVQTTNTAVSISPPHATSEQKQHHVGHQYEGERSEPIHVSLEDLLERGSAALHPPHHPSPRSLQSSPQDSSPSPLTSSYETDEQFFSIHNPPPPAPPTTEREPSMERETQMSDTPPRHVSALTDHSSGVSNPLRRSDEDEMKGLQVPNAEGVVGNSTTVASPPHATQQEKVMHKQHVQEVEQERVMERGARGLTPTREHPLTMNPNAPDSEDELFPDDAKYLHDSPEKEKGSRQNLESQTLLEIKDDHFSASPGERRKKSPVSSHQQNPRPPVPRPPPPRPVKQNSEGKVAPPRPPRSPQLQRKLMQRQSKESGVSRTHPPSRMQPTRNQATHPSIPGDAERAKLKIVRPLASAPPDPISNVATLSPPKLSPRVGLRDQTAPDSGSSVDPPSLSPSPPTDRSISTQDDDLFKDEVKTSTWATDEGLAEPPFFPLPTHLLIAGLLYIYYALNPFVYLAGLLAGFLTFYVVLGAVFILYVQNEEESSKEMTDTSTLQFAGDDAKMMDIRFEDFGTRFKTRKFTATLDYDPTTHHRKHRMISDLELRDNYFLHIKVWNSDSEIVLRTEFDLREVRKLTIVPMDVFQNRKRRWSKKYPIEIESVDHHVFLFANTSRKKEEWFRRLREAQSGKTTEDLIANLKVFLRYIKRYFPNDPVSASRNPAEGPVSGVALRNQHKRHRPDVGIVQFSSAASTSIDGGSINISRSTSKRHQPGPPLPSSAASSSHAHRQLTPSGSAGYISSRGSAPQYTNTVTATRPSSASSSQYTRSNGRSEYTLQPSLSSTAHLHARKETDWINVLAARLCWDVWHEERWKKWVMSRIQKKLIRVKTPGFMENLQLTDVALGDKMPVVNRLCEGPYVRLDGVWVYLDVTYEGLFVMTIKTKLKLGQGVKEEKGTEMKVVTHRSSHATTGHISRSGTGTVSHSQAARALGMESSVDPEDDSDTGSEDEGAQPVPHPLDGDSTPHHSSTSPASHPSASTQKKKVRGAKLINVMTKLTRTVVSTRFVQRAAERVSKVPLELTVEVKKLRGILAVNISPPPSDTIWYGFKDTPKLELVAKPKLGQKEVTLSHVTHWIEKRLCALVDEKLKLPNMEDLVIPILNSGLPEDVQSALYSPDPNASLS